MFNKWQMYPDSDSEDGLDVVFPPSLPMDHGSHPLEHASHPLERGSHTLEHGSHPLEHGSHPMEGEHSSVLRHPGPHQPLTGHPGTHPSSHPRSQYHNAYLMSPR